MAGEERPRNWFEKYCAKLRPVWDARMAELADADDKDARTKLAEQFAANARGDLLRLEAEINLMVVRTAAILTAATLLFAVYALKPSVKLFAGSLAIALCFAALGFVASLFPMTPPIIRAWFKPYESRQQWTLYVHDAFTSWAMDCWLSKRRQDVVTRYKRAHAVVVPVLIVAAVFLVCGAIANLAQ